MNTCIIAPPRRRLRPPAWLAIPLLLAGCSTLDPAGDINRAASLTMSRVGPDAAAVWQQPVDQPSTAWNGMSPLTADAALIVSLQNEPELRMLLAEIAQRRVDLVQSELLPNPTVGFGVGIATVGLSGAPAIVQGLQALTWLWTRPDRIAIAEAGLQQSILAAASGAVDLTAKIATDHARVLAAQELASLDEQNLAITEQTLDIVGRRLDVGEAAELDLDRAELDMQSARTAVIASIRALEQAKLTLLLDMGWPSHDTGWTAAEPVGAMPPRDGRDDALCELAVLQRLDLAAAQATVERELAGLALAGTKRLPEVRFTFGWQRNFMDRKAVMPGASLTIPIFDDGGPAIARASATLEAARLAWLDLANHVQYSVRDAGSKWRQASEESRVTALQLLPAVERAVSRSRAAYAEGVVDLTVLLLAQERHIAAQRTMVAQRLSEAESLIELRRAVGGTFEHVEDGIAASTTEREDAS